LRNNGAATSVVLSVIFALRIDYNGMANVLDFYDQDFHIGFDNRERMDLIVFLSSL